jgi:TRAP-type C4-dicarboxylate transport system permease small subunit
LKVLDTLARLCALLAGVLLTAITAMTCVSVVGRNFLGATLAGDFELTGVATGLAVALFMPWCQLRHGNICVDFFTRRLKAPAINQLDRTAALLMGAFTTLLAWRTALGGVNAWETQAGSMLLGFPDWVVFAGMVPPLALTGVIALWQAGTGQTA